MPGPETNNTPNQMSSSCQASSEPLKAEDSSDAMPPQEVKLCPKVQLELGLVALESNEGLAVRYFWSAAKQGLAEAQFCLGLAYEDGVGFDDSDPSAAAYWYKRAAEQNHPGAENNLGMLLEHGKGIAKDEAKAAEMYLRAAEQGLVAGKYNFARILEQGRVVVEHGASTDPLSSVEKLSLAVQFFCDLAEQGLVNAQFRTALMILQGKGCVKDKALGRWWLELAAKHEHQDAIALLAKLPVEDGTATSQAIVPHKDRSVGSKPAKNNRQRFFTAVPLQLANLHDYLAPNKSYSHLAIVPYDGRCIEEKLGLNRAAPR